MVRATAVVTATLHCWPYYRVRVRVRVRARVIAYMAHLKVDIPT